MGVQINADLVLLVAAFVNCRTIRASMGVGYDKCIRHRIPPLRLELRKFKRVKEMWSSRQALVTNGPHTPNMAVQRFYHLGARLTIQISRRYALNTGAISFRMLVVTRTHLDALSMISSTSFPTRRDLRVHAVPEDPEYRGSEYRCVKTRDGEVEERSGAWDVSYVGPVDVILR
jgi:hypothetical protein